MLKSIGSILAGFVVVFALSTVTDIILHATGVMPSGALFDTKLLLLALAYRTVYTVLGGYTTARLAPSKPMKHAIILGCVGIVAGTIGAIVMRDMGPAWYAWALPIESLPCCWLGGKIYAKA